ncbi:unnamed protein product [Paramecium sonneborni]|uniref:MORN repeat protein n=1 Tax=Paramecium sonneborni TaxID=65129 RepID=A0A8S1N9D2_9CILI|nr:unnamed protein product [Paramecium sonneborni]
MDFKQCQKDDHQGQPVTFIVQENNHWTMCCGMCQFESKLPKQSFTAIKDLEKINQETIETINQSEIINCLEHSLELVKDWQSMFENLLLELKNLFLQKINYYNSLIETLKENYKFFILNDNKLQEVLECREKINFNLIKQLDEISILEINMNNAYEILKQSSIFQSSEDEITQGLIEEKQNDNQEKSQTNSIIKEQQKNNDTQVKIKEEPEVLKLENLYQISFQINENKCNQEDQLGIYKLQINQNEYYEGQFYKGMMHGKGKLIKKTQNYECIYEGEFYENQKHGRGKETIIETQIKDFNQSFFESMNINRPTYQKKTELIGEFKNNKKIDIFTKIQYTNDIKQSEIYLIFKDGVLISEMQ